MALPSHCTVYHQLARKGFIVRINPICSDKGLTLKLFTDAKLPSISYNPVDKTKHLFPLPTDTVPQFL